MSLLEAKGYLGGWENVPHVSNQGLQVLSGDRQNKACPWATMVWVSQLRIYLPIWIRIH